MNELKISFNFLEDYETDRLTITVNEQRFVQEYSVYMINNKGKDFHRERARLFGEALVNIGKEIKKQVTHGQPGTVVNDHLVAKYF